MENLAGMTGITKADKTLNESFPEPMGSEVDVHEHKVITSKIPHPDEAALTNIKANADSEQERKLKANHLLA